MRIRARFKARLNLTVMALVSEGGTAISAEAERKSEGISRLA